MGETKAAAARTPAKTPSTAKKSGQAPSTGKQSTGKQQSILGFFTRTPAAGSASAPNSSPSVNPTTTLQESSKSKSNSMAPLNRRANNATPVPSSDAIEPTSSQENKDASTVKQKPKSKPAVLESSPTRKVRRVIHVPAPR